VASIHYVESSTSSNGDWLGEELICGVGSC
jgi:hypothetical protein